MTNFDRAVELQNEGEAYSLRGDYIHAAVFFEFAAEYAITPEGRAVLLDKAHIADQLARVQVHSPQTSA